GSRLSRPLAHAPLRLRLHLFQKVLHRLGRRGHHLDLLLLLRRGPVPRLGEQADPDQGGEAPRDGPEATTYPRGRVAAAGSAGELGRWRDTSCQDGICVQGRM
ncbi:hypothetical protein E4U53_000638, partial [Claviceps sorghi]